MKRAEILARGDLQRAGFRDVVQKIAKNLEISGTVQNQEPYDVRIAAEGEEEGLKEFVEALSIDAWEFYHGECSYRPQPEKTIGMPNHASVYCQIHGYRL